MNLNHPPIHQGKLREAEVIARNWISDADLAELMRRHPVTQDQIDDAQNVGSADWLLFPIGAVCIIMTIALSALFARGWPL